MSSQVYALDAVKYGSVLLLQWLGRSETWRHVGGAVLGLGLVFFALTHLEHAAEPLRDYEPFRALMLRMENPSGGCWPGRSSPP